MNTTSESAVDRTEELCRLFSSTLSSLASDASALREIAALESACGLGVVDGMDEENENSNAIIDGLCHLDEAVSALEGKVQTLTEIVTEEKRSLDELGVLHESAKAQGRVLDGMLEACHRRLMQQQEVAMRKSSTGRNEATHTQQEKLSNVPSTRPSSLRRKSPILEGSSSAEAESLPVASARKPLSTRQNRRDSIDPRRLPAKATADHGRGHHQSHHYCGLVTEAELGAVSKTIRGRITLAVVNDALVDIERACLRKQQQRRTRSFHNSSDDQQWVVSEQDLRQTCAFFRSGESTARAILLLLRSLKRLKQIPGKHSEVNYVLSGC
jgi:hypothetical protein